LPLLCKTLPVPAALVPALLHHFPLLAGALEAPWWLEPVFGVRAIFHFWAAGAGSWLPQGVRTRRIGCGALCCACSVRLVLLARSLPFLPLDFFLSLLLLLSSFFFAKALQ
tara:strand:+ start:260 stop:592 length:333 start_codon:yes stop_codon:yes gene_type:complete